MRTVTNIENIIAYLTLYGLLVIAYIRKRRYLERGTLYPNTRFYYQNFNIIHTHIFMFHKLYLH